jgi:hypothetical protein
MRSSMRFISVSLVHGTIAVGTLGCGSSTSSSSPSGSGIKAPIVVGGVWSAWTNTGADTGAEAAFDAFNAAGGLDGRMIESIGM